MFYLMVFIVLILKDVDEVYLMIKNIF